MCNRAIENTYMEAKEGIRFREKGLIFWNTMSDCWIVWVFEKRL